MPVGGLALDVSRMTARDELAQKLLDIVGRANVRLLWLPQPGEGLVQPDYFVPGRNWTFAAAPKGRWSQQGGIWVLNFSTNVAERISTPDANDLSYGNGAADSPFSVVAAANVTDTAAARAIISKSDTGGIEWNFTVNAATDQLNFFVMDNSSASVPFRSSNAAVNQGKWSVYGASYPAGGGATPENTMILYQDGAVMASAANASAGYVAMENLASPVVIGAQTPTTPANPFTGLLGPILVCAGALSAGQQLDASNVIRRAMRL